MRKYPVLYKKYFVDKGDERLDLFRIIFKEFDIQKGLYPGSFTHITPSLVIPEMAYVDSDKRCEKFYQSNNTETFVFKNKEYDASPLFRFHQADFSVKLDEEDNYFDLLISLYAGFISKYCQRYLKKGGILLANNSHGDAPLAYIDENFEFIGVINVDFVRHHEVVFEMPKRFFRDDVAGYKVLCHFSGRPIV